MSFDQNVFFASKNNEQVSDKKSQNISILILPKSVACKWEFIFSNAKHQNDFETHMLSQIR